MAFRREKSRAAIRLAVVCCLVLVLMTGAALGAAQAVNVQQQVTINRAVLNIVTTTTTPPGTTTCQDPYSCLYPGEADQKWGSGNYLASGTTPCGYSTAAATAVVAKYCYAQTVTCQDPCQCLSPVEARQKWGGDMSQCSASPCGKTIPLTDTLPVVKYCYQQKSAPVRVVQPVVSLVTVKLPTCPAGQTVCIGTAVSCVNTSSDTKNCGSCGHACGINQECVNGNCRVKVEQLQTVDPCLLQGKRTCSGACADLSSDVFNCGSCGNICDQGFKCIGGQCSLGCAQGYDECRYDCVNLKTDPENCGDCGISCDTNKNQVCKNGLCACKGDMLICDPKVGCSDVDSNPKQCGSCNNVCSPTETCVQGHCTNICDLGPSHFSKFSWADWQGMNWMTAVKNQGQCGSCWAFGPVSVTEAMYNIEHRSQKNLDISEEELVSPCFASGISGDCLGGDYGGSLKYLKSSGLVSEAVYPYKSQNEAKSVPNAGDPAHSHLECNVQKNHCSTPSACTDSTLGSTRWGITSSAFLPVNANNKPDNINEMKKELLCHGPLVVGSSNWWHVVALVGWDDSTQQWTIKNSWGTDPATNYDGYEKIHYYNDFNSDIMNSSAWVQGVTGQ